MFPPEIFSDTTQIAANQGVYNLFLAAGLLWSLLIRDSVWSRNIMNCFLLFVLVAGVVASITISANAGLAQLLPSLLGLVFNNTFRRN